MSEELVPNGYRVFDCSHGKPHFLVKDHLNSCVYVFGEWQEEEALLTASEVEKKTFVGTKVETIKEN